MYALIKLSCFAVWNDKYTNNPKAAHYKQISQTIENGICGSRSCDSPIRFRPQTGHNSLNFDLHRIGLHPDGLCQGCQTYGPRAKSGPLRGWIRPAGFFVK